LKGTLISDLMSKGQPCPTSSASDHARIPRSSGHYMWLLSPGSCQHSPQINDLELWYYRWGTWLICSTNKCLL